MPRLARVVIKDMPHHITQRGNGRQQVFFGPADYSLYLGILRSNARKSKLRILGYCLMPNHVHIIAVPPNAESLAGALGRTHASYARYFNMQRDSSGHVWQARFFSCPMDDAHFWRALTYVERNPVRGGLTTHAGIYQWSSAEARLTSFDKTGLLDLTPWRDRYNPERWGQVLSTGVDEEALGERLHEATRLGRPLGDEAFVADLEARTGRILQPQRPGPKGTGRDSILNPRSKAASSGDS